MDELSVDFFFGRLGCLRGVKRNVRFVRFEMKFEFFESINWLINQRYFY